MVFRSGSPIRIGSESKIPYEEPHYHHDLYYFNQPLIYLGNLHKNLHWHGPVDLLQVINKHVVLSLQAAFQISTYFKGPFGHVVLTLLRALTNI